MTNWRKDYLKSLRSMKVGTCIYIPRVNGQPTPQAVTGWANATAFGTFTSTADTRRMNKEALRPFECVELYKRSE